MLIRFTACNFKSINEEISFNLTPSKKVRRHVHHVKNINDSFSALRGALIYGANASGKSNLCEAMETITSLILEEKSTITPFDSNRPTKIEFEYFSNGIAYAFGFEYFAGKFIEEWLYNINDDNEELIYKYGSDTENKLKLSSEIVKNLDDESNLYLKFLFRSKSESKLFAQELIRKNDLELEPFLGTVKKAIEWFLDTLLVINPHASYMKFEEDLIADPKSKIFYEIFLKAFDTGIDNISIYRHKIIDLDEGTRAKINQVIETNIDEQGIKWGFTINSPDGRFNVSVDENNNIENIFEVVFENNRKCCKKNTFSYDELSDGTRRLIDLIPALYKSIYEGKVFVIDEIDRSIHPIIIKILLEFFYSEKITPNGQIIVTTHDTGVMEQEFLRKDEIWFVQKEYDGSSLLYALDEYSNEVRNDKSLIKDYLNGRYGAVVNYKMAKSIIEELYNATN
ncbi:TPA: ATP-binding protein [Vibrio vulnificus]|nr:ATP-binding protein [Vibrio vulnificus]HDY7874424.1 ATP-binding protein [Vibrio vulnificus]